MCREFLTFLALNSAVLSEIFGQAKILLTDQNLGGGTGGSVPSLPSLLLTMDNAQWDSLCIACCCSVLEVCFNMDSSEAHRMCCNRADEHGTVIIFLHEAVSSHQ